MSRPQLHDVNIGSITPLYPPQQYLKGLPIGPAARVMLTARRQIADILTGKDSRLLLVAGPCSIHDHKAGLEYATRLFELSLRLQSKILIVMRAYLEKPRTTLGWKGLISDPDLNGTYDMGSGLWLAREFLLKIAEMGLPAAT